MGNVSSACAQPEQHSGSAQLLVCNDAHPTPLEGAAAQGDGGAVLHHLRRVKEEWWPDACAVQRAFETAAGTCDSFVLQAFHELRWTLRPCPAAHGHRALFAALRARRPPLTVLRVQGNSRRMPPLHHVLPLLPQVLQCAEDFERHRVALQAYRQCPEWDPAAHAKALQAVHLAGGGSGDFLACAVQHDMEAFSCTCLKAFPVHTLRPHCTVDGLLQVAVLHKCSTSKAPGWDCIPGLTVRHVQHAAQRALSQDAAAPNAVHSGPRHAFVQLVHTPCVRRVYHQATGGGWKRPWGDAAEYWLWCLGWTHLHPGSLLDPVQCAQRAAAAGNVTVLSALLAAVKHTRCPADAAVCVQQCMVAAFHAACTRGRTVLLMALQGMEEQEHCVMLPWWSPRHLETLRGASSACLTDHVRSCIADTLPYTHPGWGALLHITAVRGHCTAVALMLQSVPSVALHTMQPILGRAAAGAFESALQTLACSSAGDVPRTSVLRTLGSVLQAGGCAHVRASLVHATEARWCHVLRCLSVQSQHTVHSWNSAVSRVLSLVTPNLPSCAVAAAARVQQALLLQGQGSAASVLSQWSRAPCGVLSASACANVHTLWAASLEDAAQRGQAWMAAWFVTHPPLAPRAALYGAFLKALRAAARRGDTADTMLHMLHAWSAPQCAMLQYTEVQQAAHGAWEDTDAPQAQLPQLAAPDNGWFLQHQLSRLLRSLQRSCTPSAWQWVDGVITTHARHHQGHLNSAWRSARDAHQFPTDGQLCSLLQVAKEAIEANDAQGVHAALQQALGASPQVSTYRMRQLARAAVQANAPGAMAAVLHACANPAWGSHAGSVPNAQAALFVVLDDAVTACCAAGGIQVWRAVISAVCRLGGTAGVQVHTWLALTRRVCREGTVADLQAAVQAVAGLSVPDAALCAILTACLTAHDEGSPVRTAVLRGVLHGAVWGFPVTPEVLVTCLQAPVHCRRTCAEGQLRLSTAEVLLPVLRRSPAVADNNVRLLCARTVPEDVARLALCTPENKLLTLCALCCALRSPSPHALLLLLQRAAGNDGDALGVLPLGRCFRGAVLREVHNMRAFMHNPLPLHLSTLQAQRHAWKGVPQNYAAALWIAETADAVPPRLQKTLSAFAKRCSHGVTAQLLLQRHGINVHCKHSLSSALGSADGASAAALHMDNSPTLLCPAACPKGACGCLAWLQFVRAVRDARAAVREVLWCRVYGDADSIMEFIA